MSRCRGGLELSRDARERVARCPRFPTQAQRGSVSERSRAGGGHRTHTPLAGPRILSPVRLPVPPPRHTESGLIVSMILSAKPGSRVDVRWLARIGGVVSVRRPTPLRRSVGRTQRTIRTYSLKQYRARRTTQDRKGRKGSSQMVSVRSAIQKKK